MRLSLDNFLYGIKQIVCGQNAATNNTGTASAADGGFKRDVAVALSDLQLLGAGNAIAAEETHAFVLKVAHAIPAVGTLSFPVPRDYDEASDHLILRVYANQAAAVTDHAVSLSATPYVKPLGAALVVGAAVNGTAPFGSATAILNTTEQVVEFNLSGLGLVRDSIVYIALAASGNATLGDEVQVFAVETTYDSTLVSYNDTDSSGVDGKLSQSGNPLR